MTRTSCAETTRFHDADVLVVDARRCRRRPRRPAAGRVASGVRRGKPGRGVGEAGLVEGRQEDRPACGRVVRAGTVGSNHSVVPADLDLLEVAGQVGERGRGPAPSVRVDHRARSRSDAGPCPRTNRRVSSRRASSTARSSERAGRHRLVDEHVGVLGAARRPGADDRPQLGDDQQVPHLLPGWRESRARRSASRSPRASAGSARRGTTRAPSSAAAASSSSRPSAAVACRPSTARPATRGRCIQRRSSGRDEVPRRPQHVGAHPAAGRLLGEHIGIRRPRAHPHAERPRRQRRVLGLHACEQLHDVGPRAQPGRGEPLGREPAAVHVGAGGGSASASSSHPRTRSRRTAEADRRPSSGRDVPRTRRSAERPTPHRPSRHTCRTLGLSRRCPGLSHVGSRLDFHEDPPPAHRPASATTRSCTASPGKWQWRAAAARAGRRSRAAGTAPSPLRSSTRARCRGSRVRPGDTQRVPGPSSP